MLALFSRPYLWFGGVNCDTASLIEVVGHLPLRGKELPAVCAENVKPICFAHESSPIDLVECAPSAATHCEHINWRALVSSSSARTR